MRQAKGRTKVRVTKAGISMRTVRELLLIALLFFISTLALMEVDKRCADMRSLPAAGDLLQEEILQISAKAVELQRDLG